MGGFQWVEIKMIKNTGFLEQHYMNTVSRDLLFSGILLRCCNLYSILIHVIQNYKGYSLYVGKQRFKENTCQEIIDLLTCVSLVLHYLVLFRTLLGDLRKPRTLEISKKMGWGGNRPPP